MGVPCAAMVERLSRDEVCALPLFRGLSRSDAEPLSTLARVVTVEAGDTLFAEGDPPGALYVVLEGRVTLCMRIPGRPDLCFLSLRGGELLGWSSLLARRRVATAHVAAPSRLLELPVSELLELCERDHHVGYRIMQRAFEEMADRLYATRLQLLDIFGKAES